MIESKDVIILVLSAMCLTCAVLEFACLRDPDIPDNTLSTIGRRLAIVGWLFFCGRLIQVSLEDFTPNIPLLSCLAFFCLALGNIVRCVNRLNLPCEEFRKPVQ